MNLNIPYAKKLINFNLNENRVKGILTSRVDDFSTEKSQEKIVKDSLENPIASEPLKELAKKSKRVLIITSDHTRPVPSKITLPILLEKIRKGNSKADVKILVATGSHRADTYEEMTDRFGSDIVNNEVIVNHDCRDEKNMIYKGILPSGGVLRLNSLVDWTDLIISEGFIEPHFFAGFSGGRKSILPGISAEKTVYANHCSEMIASVHAKTGNIENNPLQKDMIFASNVANLRFILNVVINTDKKIINAFSGHYKKAHEKGCEFVRNLAEVKAVKGDIVITSNGGYPLDQNIYQSVKGMTAAESCVRDSGIIIMVAACNYGHGGDSFYRFLANALYPEDTIKKILCIPQSETLAEQWEAQILARILKKSKVIMVTDECSKKFVEDMHMIYSFSLERALEIAEKEVGKNSDIVVIPDGVGVIVK